MALTINTKAYAFDTFRSVDSARYHGPSHTLSNKDYLDVKRTAPKKSADYAGQGKANAKMTRSMTDGVSSDIVGDGIFELNSSFPVGTSTAEQQAFLDDYAAWLGTAEATSLLLNQDINQ